MAIRLLKETHNFKEALMFYWPKRSLVVKPEDTVIGMKGAASRLANALNNGEKLAIFSDYDPDGTCGTEAFRLALTGRGKKICQCSERDLPKGKDILTSDRKTPDSTDPNCPLCNGAGKIDISDDQAFMIGYADAKQGFGLTDDYVRDAHKAGAKILITLDCGSTQTSQVQLAQSLGMEVIVVDHHNIDPDNPADWHLNPLLYKQKGEEVSGNTGAQLAWKLGAAILGELDGKAPAAYWGRAMYLAGFGCRADMGSVKDLENRAFFWCPLDTEGEGAVPPGIKLLAETLGEDPCDPGGLIMTSAAMNLPKRTHLVQAADVGAILSSKSVEEAEPFVTKLIAAYEAAKPMRRQMAEIARLQLSDPNTLTHEQKQADILRKALAKDDQDEAVGTPLPENIDFADLRKIARANKNRLIGAVIIEDMGDYAGYTGTVASKASRDAKKPVMVFAAKGKDEEGQELYKFSLRNEAGIKHAVGELQSREDMRLACTLKHLNESGEVEETPVIGGHAEVTSGVCTKENVEAVIKAANTWAAEKASTYQGWEPPPYTGAEAYLTESDVPSERYSVISEQAARLAPFSRKDRHRPVQFSTRAQIKDVALDQESGYYKGVFVLPTGEEEEVMLPEDRALALSEDGKAEYVITRGEKGRNLFIRHWYRPLDI